MMNRRGTALLAALWFVVAIATVGLGLSLETREHCSVGLAAADHRAAEAAAVAGLAIAQARVERVLRQPFRTMVFGGVSESMRAADPLLDADTLFRKPLSVGQFAVRIHVEDLEGKLNISSVGVPQLRAFLAFLLRDFAKADALAQAIDDWRDRDDLRQPRGAERRDYLAHHRLDLPANRGGFRNLEELQAVEGMTPEIFALIRPYLRVQGRPTINVNTAPAAVLRAIPGIDEATIMRILAVRSQRQRITSWAELPTSLANLRAGGWGDQLSFVVDELELTVTVSAPAAPVVQETWTMIVNTRGSIGQPTFVNWADATS